jgi:ATP-dependent DNA ligase
VEAARKMRITQFIEGDEAVVLGVDGRSSFEDLRSGKFDDEVQLYTFDLIAMDGDDPRALPFSLRKSNLARLLARRPEGIFLADYEQGEIGPDPFRKACEFNLERLVSKHKDRAYGPRAVHRLDVAVNSAGTRTHLAPSQNSHRKASRQPSTPTRWARCSA